MKRPLDTRNGHRHRAVEISKQPFTAPARNGDHPVFENHHTHPLLADPFKDLPVLGYLNQDGNLLARKPFRGLAVVALLHCYPNAVAMARTWLDFGAEAHDIFFFHKEGYGYDADGMVKGALLLLGINVLPVSALTADFMARLSAHLAADSKQFIVCEDGGLVASQVYQHPVLVEKCVGCVEQTTKGLWRTQAVTKRPRKPHLALPMSEFKQKFEPPHVAQAFVRTLDIFLSGYCYLRDMRIAVLGCAGCIGSHIADLLLDYTPHVTVFDKNLPRLYRLLNRNFEIADSVNEAVAGKDAVIGCTGSCAIGLNEMSRVKDGCVIASASSEQAEVNMAMLERLKMSSEQFVPAGVNGSGGEARGTVYRLRPHGKRLVLLNNGFPLNFAYGANLNPFPFDLVMALLLAGSIELALGTYASKRGFLNVFDELDTRYQLSETYANIHRNH